MLKKTLPVLLALLLLFAFIPAAASAAGGGITMSVEVGWDGKYVVTCATPVVVTIKNDGKEISGTLELLTGTGFNVLVRRDVVLPQGTEKRFTLFMMASGILQAKDFEVRLKKGVSTVASAQPKAAAGVDPGLPLGGILSDDPAALSYMKTITSLQYGTRTWVNLAAESIYENADLMGSFGVIAVSNFDASKLTDAQRGAIRQWVYSGGTLVFGAGPGREGAASSWREFLGGVAFEGTSTESGLSSLSSLANGTAFEGSLPVSGIKAEGWLTVASSGAGAPLVLEKGFGRGFALLSAFDMGDGAMGSWKGSPALWQTLLERYSNAGVSQYNPYYGYYGGNSGMLTALQSGLAGGGLTFWLFMAILLMFTALAGFASFLILRALGKQKLMWVTVPALAVLFSGMLLFLGRNSFGRPPALFAYSTTDISGGVALSEHTLGFAAPAMGDYRVAVGGAGLLFPAVTPDYSNYGPGQAQLKRPVATVASADGAELKFLNVNLNGTRSSRFSSFSDQAPLEIGIAYDGSSVSCKLKNVSPFTIEDVAVMIGMDLRVFGDIAPGSEQEATMSFDQTPLDQSMWNIVGQLYPSAYGGPYGGFRGVGNRDDMIRSSFLQERLSTLLYGGNGGAAQTVTGADMLGRALVLGWIAKPFEYDVKVNGRVVKPQSLELITSLSPIILADTGGSGLQFAKAYGQVNTTLTGPSGGTMKGNVVIIEPGKSAVLDFVLSNANTLDLSDMYFDAGAQAGMNPGTWTIYNWQTQAWDVTIPRQHYTKDEIARYVDPSGLVRLTVNSGQGDYIECLPYVWAQGVGK